MSLKIYDDAMVEKFKKVFPNTIFSYAEKELYHGSDDNLQVILPLISIDRLNNNLNNSTWANELSGRRGSFDKTSTGKMIKNFPVELRYQIDLVSNRREECDDLFRETIQFILEDNYLNVPFNFGDDTKYYEFAIRLEDTDNLTEQSEFSDKGRLYKQIITVSLQAQFLYTEDIAKISSIPIRYVDAKTMEDI